MLLLMLVASLACSNTLLPCTDAHACMSQFHRASEDFINKNGYDINDRTTLAETVPYMYGEYTKYAKYRKADQDAGKFILQVGDRRCLS